MDNQNQDLKLNRELSGSKRRSRLNLGIATLPNSGSFAGSNGSLGIIEMVGNTTEPPTLGGVAGIAKGGAGFGSSSNDENVQTEKSVTQDSTVTPESVKPSLSSQSVVSDVLGTDKLLDNNRWKLLRRSKQLLAMRTVTPELASKLELRRDWNLHRKVETLLDCFPSLKHSYSSLRGKSLVALSQS